MPAWVFSSLSRAIKASSSSLRITPSSSSLSGAAELLGLHPNTLRYRIKKLAITTSDWVVDPIRPQY